MERIRGSRPHSNKLLFRFVCIFLDEALWHCGTEAPELLFAPEAATAPSGTLGSPFQRIIAFFKKNLLFVKFNFTFKTFFKLKITIIQSCQN